MSKQIGTTFVRVNRKAYVNYIGCYDYYASLKTLYDRCFNLSNPTSVVVKRSYCDEFSALLKDGGRWIVVYKNNLMEKPLHDLIPFIEQIFATAAGALLTYGIAAGSHRHEECASVTAQRQVICEKLIQKKYKWQRDIEVCQYFWDNLADDIRHDSRVSRSFAQTCFVDGLVQYGKDFLVWLGQRAYKASYEAFSASLPGSTLLADSLGILEAHKSWYPSVLAQMSFDVKEED